jgi:phosphatidylinositol alpha-1,6-mannosyltransferase
MIVARIDEQGGYKGHRELIACWPNVVSRVPAARLRIVGSGPGREVVGGLVRESPARASIDLLGFVPEHALPRLFQQSAVLAMPSRGEGFGLAYAEAMRHGVPVIASVHDAAPEINLDGVTGFNVDLDQGQALPQALIRLLSQPELARSMGRAAQQHWREELCYSRFADRFLPILRSLWT